jgi:hypothetical protein
VSWGLCKGKVITEKATGIPPPHLKEEDEAGSEEEVGNEQEDESEEETMTVAMAAVRVE